MKDIEEVMKALRFFIEWEMGDECRFDLGHPNWATWNRVAIDAFVKRKYPNLFDVYKEFFYKLS